MVNERGRFQARSADLVVLCFSYRTIQVLCLPVECKLFESKDYISF